MQIDRVDCQLSTRCCTQCQSNHRSEHHNEAVVSTLICLNSNEVNDLKANQSARTPLS